MHADEPHPELQAFIAETEDRPSFHEMGVEAARTVADEVFAVETPRPVGEVIDRTIDGPGGDLSLRIYLPEADGPHPVTTFFHGGGFVAGSLDSVDQLSRALADEAETAVVSVDYRLAPDHPFPAAVKDAFAATAWVADNAGAFDSDPDRLAVAGASAGGNLAAVVAQMATQRGGPTIAHQVLAYPVTSYDREWPSHTEMGSGYFLSREDLAWFADQYFADELDRWNVYASPILTANLTGLPSASVVTAGFDPLRDEGLAYVDRLADAGVDVSHHHHGDAIHGFLQLATEPFGLAPAQEALADIVADLQARLH